MNILDQARADYIRRIRYHVAQFLKEGDCTEKQAREWAIATIEAEDRDQYQPAWKGPDDREPIFI
jgi:hypothetical protein